MKRKATASGLGYRSLTKGELRAAGYSAGSRRYTTVAPGKFKANSPSFSRRKVEERVTGKTLEKAADQRAIATHGKSRLSLSASGKRFAEGAATRYDWHLRAWAATHDQTIGQARRDPQRKADWKAIVDARRAIARGDQRPLAADGKYAKALENVGLRSADYTWRVGDTPKYTGSVETRYDAA